MKVMFRGWRHFKALSCGSDSAEELYTVTVCDTVTAPEESLPTNQSLGLR